MIWSSIPSMASQASSTASCSKVSCSPASGWSSALSRADLLGRPETGQDHASRREDRGAHNDAVEISGIALHGHQPLAPAGGTTAKIGVIGCPRVVPLGKLLADNRGQMDRTMPEVFDGDMVRHTLCRLPVPSSPNLRMDSGRDRCPSDRLRIPVPAQAGIDDLSETCRPSRRFRPSETDRSTRRHRETGI